MTEIKQCPLDQAILTSGLNANAKIIPQKPSGMFPRSSLRNLGRMKPTAPPNSSRAGGPPPVNRLDHQIGLHNGSTSVFELTPQQVQLSKLNPPANLLARVEELTRQLGQLRSEMQFYRETFDILQRLRETICDVYQQLYLAHYLDHNLDRMNELMLQLHRGLEDSVRREAKAKKNWMEFWGIDFNEKEYEENLM